MKGIIKIIAVCLLAFASTVYADQAIIPAGDVNDVNPPANSMPDDAEALLATIRNISDASNKLAAKTGSFAGSISTALVANEMPGKALNSPSGQPITITNVLPAQYTVIIPSVAPGLCAAVQNAIKSSEGFTNISMDNPCSATEAVSMIYTYKLS